jgi:hydrogenase nickel insertion protein HypA
MHEAGIANSVLEIASGLAVERGPGATVAVVRLRIGEFTGVACEAFQFAFEALRDDATRCATARLEIQRIPLRGECPAGCWSGAPEEPFDLRCPQCGSALSVLSGRELDVASVDILENEDGTSISRNADS